MNQYTEKKLSGPLKKIVCKQKEAFDSIKIHLNDDKFWYRYQDDYKKTWWKKVDLTTEIQTVLDSNTFKLQSNAFKKQLSFLKTWPNSLITKYYFSFTNTLQYVHQLWKEIKHQEKSPQSQQSQQSQQSTQSQESEQYTYPTTKKRKRKEMQKETNAKRNKRRKKCKKSRDKQLEASTSTSASASESPSASGSDLPITLSQVTEHIEKVNKQIAKSNMAKMVRFGNNSKFLVYHPSFDEFCGTSSS